MNTKLIGFSLIATLVPIIGFGYFCNPTNCYEVSQTSGGLTVNLWKPTSTDNTISAKSIATQQPDATTAALAGIPWDKVNVNDYITLPNKTSYLVNDKAGTGKTFSFALIPAKIPENAKVSHWICGPTGACIK